MRRWLLLLLMVPLAAPQATDWSPVGDDPRGDVAIQDQAVDGASLDLVSLYAAEMEDLLWLRIGMADFNEDERTTRDSAIYEITFAIGEQAYRILAHRTVPVAAPTPNYDHELQWYDAVSDRWESMDTPVVFEADEKNAFLMYGMPWTEIPDEKGLRILPGGTIQGLSAVSRSWWEDIPSGIRAGIDGEETAPLVTDRLPDDGLLTYAIDRLGQDGDLVVTSQNPLRASNGAPTTYLFPIELSNVADADVYVELVAEGMPEGWRATPLATPILVPAGQSVTSSIVVATASQHQHGGMDSFEVRALVDGQTAGTVAYEIHYTETAQPSGHHPYLYVFTISSSTPTGQVIDDAMTAATGYYFNDAYMSTLAENERDDKVPVTATAIGDGGRGWPIPLSPTLGLGLDFEPRPGVVAFEVEPARPTDVENTRFDAVLRLEQRDNTTDLMRGSLDVGTVTGRTAFQLPLEVLPDIDVVPYERDQNLRLDLYVTHDDLQTGGIELHLLPGGEITLPLEEYQDPIPEGSISPLTMTAEPRIQSIRPGGLADYILDIQGPGAIQLDALGVPDGWTVRFGDTSVTAGNVLLQVTAPADARINDAANFFVRATPEDGAPTAVGIRAYVVSDTGIPEPEPLTPEIEKKSPSVAPWTLLAVALALARRSVTVK